MNACNYSENEEFDIQMEQVLGSIYNVTWNVPLAVENIAYITVTVMGTVTVVHPNQTSILLQLEDSNECRVNVTVVDKCDRKYSNSTGNNPHACQHIGHGTQPYALYAHASKVKDIERGCTFNQRTSSKDFLEAYISSHIAQAIIILLDRRN